MQYTLIVKLIMEKGVDNVSVPETLRFQVFTEAGTFLFKEQRYEEAGKSFARAGNSNELLSAAEWLTRQCRHKDAAYLYVHMWEREKMEACALACIHQGAEKEARMLYQVLGNKEMLAFLQNNFGI